MKMFYSLGEGDELVDPAIRLSRYRQVIVRPRSPAAAAELSAHRFLPIIDALHVVASRSALSRHPSRLKQMRAQLRTIGKLGLTVRVLSGAKAGRSKELMHALYYDLLVPSVFARGVSPYGVQSESRFLQLVQHCLVVIGLDTNRILRCASLYELRPLNTLTGGPFASSSSQIAVGLLEATDHATMPYRRAWRQRAIEEISDAIGVTCVSIGADDGLIDPGYAPVILDKVSWYPAIAWECSKSPRFVSFGASAAADRFPIALGVSSGSPFPIGDWGEGPTGRLREKLLRLLSDEAAQDLA